MRAARGKDAPYPDFPPARSTSSRASSAQLPTAQDSRAKPERHGGTPGEGDRGLRPPQEPRWAQAGGEGRVHCGAASGRAPSLERAPRKAGEGARGQGLTGEGRQRGPPDPTSGSGAGQREPAQAWREEAALGGAGCPHKRRSGAIPAPAVCSPTRQFSARPSHPGAASPENLRGCGVNPRKHTCREAASPRRHKLPPLRAPLPAHRRLRPPGGGAPAPHLVMGGAPGCPASGALSGPPPSRGYEGGFLHQTYGFLQTRWDERMDETINSLLRSLIPLVRFFFFLEGLPGIELRGT